MLCEELLKTGAFLLSAGGVLGDPSPNKVAFWVIQNAYLAIRDKKCNAQVYTRRLEHQKPRGYAVYTWYTKSVHLRVSVQGCTPEKCTVYTLSVHPERGSDHGTDQ